MASILSAGSKVIRKKVSTTDVRNLPDSRPMVRIGASLDGYTTLKQEEP